MCINENYVFTGKIRFKQHNYYGEKMNSIALDLSVEKNSGPSTNLVDDPWPIVIYTYPLEVNWEIEGRRDHSISYPDCLPCSVKVLRLEMLTAEHGGRACSEPIPPESYFPLFPPVAIFGKPM